MRSYDVFRRGIPASEITIKGSKETADYYYYDYEDRLVEIVIQWCQS
jgi:hypothetical protein